ncbi:hypothetical protein R3P38DRAFT_302956 [Favolaschia claudopus]|uniref:Uncharacterized protein n=1 Tax=Favolaschia claudopus TaxID=2862362 RepID=A0AAV9ZNI4_9AGAR
MVDFGKRAATTACCTPHFQPAARSRTLHPLRSLRSPRRPRSEAAVLPGPFMRRCLVPLVMPFAGALPRAKAPLLHQPSAFHHFPLVRSLHTSIHQFAFSNAAGVLRHRWTNCRHCPSNSSVHLVDSASCWSSSSPAPYASKSNLSSSSSEWRAMNFMILILKSFTSVVLLSLPIPLTPTLTPTALPALTNIHIPNSPTLIRASHLCSVFANLARCFSPLVVYIRRSL